MYINHNHPETFLNFVPLSSNSFLKQPPELSSPWSPQIPRDTWQHPNCHCKWHHEWLDQTKGALAKQLGSSTAFGKNISGWCSTPTRKRGPDFETGLPLVCRTDTQMLNYRGPGFSAWCFWCFILSQGNKQHLPMKGMVTLRTCGVHRTWPTFTTNCENISKLHVL